LRASHFLLEAPLRVAALVRTDVLHDETVFVLPLAIARFLVYSIARNGRTRIILKLELFLIGACAEISLAFLGTESFDDLKPDILLLAVHASIFSRGE